MMKRIWICVAGVSLLFSCPPAWPDIFSWTDANGVRRYSNIIAPNKVTVKRRAELPIDQAAADKRRAAEEQAWRRRKMDDEIQRNNQLTEQLAQTRQKLKQLESKTEKAFNAAIKAQEADKEKHRPRRIYPYRPHPVYPHGGIAPPSKFKPGPEIGPNTAIRQRKTFHPHSKQPPRTEKSGEHRK